MKRFKDWPRSKPMLLLAFVLIMVVLGFFTPLFKELVWIGPAEAYAYNEGTDPLANENEALRRLHVGPFSFPFPGGGDVIVSSEEQHGAGVANGNGTNGNRDSDSGINISETHDGGTNASGTNVSVSNLGETSDGGTSGVATSGGGTNVGGTNVDETIANETIADETIVVITNINGTNGSGTHVSRSNGNGNDDDGTIDTGTDDGGTDTQSSDPLAQFKALYKLASGRSKGLQDAKDARDSIVVAQESAYGNKASQDVLQELESQHKAAEQALREASVYDSISNELQTIISGFEERNDNGESWKSMEGEINEVRAEYGMPPIQIDAS